MDILTFINSLTNEDLNRIRNSKSDAEARRLLREHQALQLQQTGVMQSVLFANWIVEKGYKLNNKPFIKERDAVWFFDKKSFGSTTSELYKQYLSETVA